MRSAIWMFAAVVITSQVGRAEVVGTATVTAEDAAIYRGQDVVAQAHKGDTLQVSAVRGEWYGVISAGGWIHAKHVEYAPISGEGSARPLAAVETVIAALKAANGGDYERANELLDISWLREHLSDREFWDYWTARKSLKEIKIVSEEKKEDRFLLSFQRIGEDGNSIDGPHWQLQRSEGKWSAQPRIDGI